MILCVHSEHAKQQQEIDDEIEHLQFSFAGAGGKRGQRAQHASKDGSRSADANQSVQPRGVTLPLPIAHGTNTSPSSDR
jgi:hypothetical protein